MEPEPVGAAHRPEVLSELLSGTTRRRTRRANNVEPLNFPCARRGVNIDYEGGTGGTDARQSHDTPPEIWIAVNWRPVNNLATDYIVRGRPSEFTLEGVVVVRDAALRA